MRMKDVIISVTGVQQGVNGPDAMELVTAGQYGQDEKETLLTWQESELTGMEGTKTSLCVQPRSVVLSREGTLNTRMEFEEGRKRYFLYETPFGDAYFMACTHTRKLLEKLNAARLGMDEAAPYINTGVLLYNLPALRADLDMERVRAFADEKQDVFLLPDQDILTALYGDRVHLLDSMVYNLSDRILALHNAELRNAPVDLDWVRAHTVIIHYCGRLKPWKPHYVGVLDVFYHELMEEIQK